MATCASRAQRLIELERAKKQRGLNPKEREEATRLRRALKSAGINPGSPNLVHTALIADHLSTVKTFIKACDKANYRPGWEIQDHLKKPLQELGINPNYHELKRRMAEIKRTRNSARDTRNRHRRTNSQKRFADVGIVNTTSPRPIHDPDSLCFDERYPEAKTPYTESDYLRSAYPEYAGMMPTT